MGRSIGLEVCWTGRADHCSGSNLTRLPSTHKQTWHSCRWLDLEQEPVHCLPHSWPRSPGGWWWWPCLASDGEVSADSGNTVTTCRDESMLSSLTLTLFVCTASQYSTVAEQLLISRENARLHRHGIRTDAINRELSRSVDTNTRPPASTLTRGPQISCNMARTLTKCQIPGRPGLRPGSPAIKIVSVIAIAILEASAPLVPVASHETLSSNITPLDCLL